MKRLMMLLLALSTTPTYAEPSLLESVALQMAKEGLRSGDLNDLNECLGYVAYELACWTELVGTDWFQSALGPEGLEAVRYACQQVFL